MSGRHGPVANRFGQAHRGDEYELASDFGRGMTMNGIGQMHRMTWAKATAEARGVWHLLALDAKLPGIMACEIIATPLHRNGSSPQDVGACAPEAKAAIDGLRDACVLRDDTAGIVQRLTFEAPRICGVDGLELRIIVTA